MDKKELVEKILQSPELAKAEKTENLHVRRIATWDTPKIEYAYQNIDSLDTLAFLFPSMQDGEEVWIRDAIETLNKFDSCITCFPSNALADANYYCDCLVDRGLEMLQIGAIAYDESGHMLVIKMYVQSDTSTKKRSSGEEKSYWCWWRDASQYEVATLLELSEKYDDINDDIYTQKVYPEFYDMMINRKTKQWDGSPRNKNYSKASFKAEKQNYKIPMCQLGFWDVPTGHITDKGKVLLEVARRNGDGSNIYFSYFAKLILLDGKHLDLIKDLDDFQRKCPEIIPESSA